MSNQITITGGAKVRNLEGVLTGTAGLVGALPINVANGIPQLDSSGKILVSQLPNSVMEFLGTWNAATNTPTLANGTGNAGDVYLCNVAGTVNFGAGPITFSVGDYVVYSGSTWERSGGAVGTVTSVGLTESGDSLTITGSPVTTSGTINIGFAGTNLQYINGAGNLTTFPTLTGYVPYTGATANLDLGTYGLLGDYIGFNTSPTSVPTGIGTLSWDSFYRTLQLIDGVGETTLQIGQEERTLVHNNTGAAMVSGQVVYITGSTGELPSVGLAVNSSEAASSVTFGVVTETIDNGNDGFITTSGIVNGLNTLAFTEGAAIWLGSTAGTFTQTKPIAPANSVLVGYVVKKAGGNGSIFVKIQNGVELNEIHDVLITSVANNQGIFWDSATGLWKNKSIETVLGYTPANDSLVVHLAGSETITGVKTFSNAIKNDAGILLRNGVNSSVAGYTSIGGLSTNNGLYILLNGVSLEQNLIFQTGASYTYTFPAASGTVALTSNLSGYVPTSRTLTINGTSYDLSADRTWTINSMVYPSAGIAVSTGTAWGTSITDNSSNWNTAYSLRIATATSPLSISSNNISIAQATTSTSGYLSSTDWNTFSAKVNGSFTAGKVPFAVGSNSLADTTLNYNGGNFGFGTAASTYRIDVSGSVNVTGSYYINGVAITTGGVTGTGTTNYLPKFTSASTIGNSILQEGTNAIGLGITPSAWNSIFVAQQIGNNGGFIASRTDGINQIQFGVNGYFDGTNWIYTTNNYASRYYQASSAHIWSTAPFGTSGTAITFTQAMTLTGGGNLLIGTSTDAGYKLDVNGTGRFSNTLSIINTSGNAILEQNGGSGSTTGILMKQAGTEVGRIHFPGTTAMTFSVGSSVTTALSIASTGAATFSSSVTATQGNFNQSATSGFAITFKNRNANQTWNFVCDTDTVDDKNFGLYSSASALYALKIASTGAATFSSSVTALGAFTGYAGINGYAGVTQNLLVDWSAESQITTLTNTNLFFGTNAQRRMTITGGGNVLIGTTTDAGYLLQVAGTVNSTNTFRSTNGFMNSYESYNAWELGVPVSTSGLTLKTTSYVTVRINGSVYKLATVN